MQYNLDEKLDLNHTKILSPLGIPAPVRNARGDKTLPLLGQIEYKLLPGDKSSL